jgi:hypothetical protein
MATLGTGVLAGVAGPTLEAVFHVLEGDCVAGPTNRSFTLELRSATGSVLDTEPAVPAADGRFEVCFDRVIQPGHRLVGTAGALPPVTFRIPDLTVIANRYEDVVRGTGPAGKTLRVRLFDCDRSTLECVRKVSKTVSVKADGTWKKDFTGLFNARGFDEARVTYTANAGHTFPVTRVFPWMVVVTGDEDNRLFGEINPFTTSTFKLRDEPGGAVLASRTRTGSSSGDFSLRFGRQVHAGNQVTGTFATDAKLTVWPVLISVTFKDDDQFINGTCLPGRLMLIEWEGRRRSVQANAQGKAFVNLSLEEFEGYRLVDGAHISVSCQNTKGDGVIGTLIHET